ncbi:fimbrillin family protein [Bacteroides sp. 51]|uniref:fimbrillin family protein n=1 Tax=Bacteroides sp. 51 TaxID=2302938 RepID=UPI00194036BE|nr:fimbrillin family protein [Bacteroides sp. 51]
MKTKKMIGWLTAWAICLSACSNDHNEENQSRDVHFFSGVNRYETRVNEEGDKWSAGDVIGVFMTENNSSVVVNGARNIAYTAQNTAQSTPFAPANSDAAISYPDGGSTVDFIAYYPYKENAESFIYPISIANQATGFTKNDLLYAVSRNHNETNATNVSLSFTHQLSKVKISVVLEDGLSEVSSVTIHATNTASFNIKTGAIEDKSDISTIIPYNKEANVYEAILIPTVLNNANKVVFSIDGAKYEWIIMENDASITSLAPNTFYTFTVTINNSRVVAELVSIDNGSVSPWEEETGSGSAEKIPGSEESAKLPEAVYFNSFDSNEGLTIVGGGSFVTDSEFGNVFQNATGGMRTNYLLLPEDILSHSAVTQEMSIGVWVNAKNAGESSTYAWSPLFTAHGAAPMDGANTWPMFALQYRGVMQINCAGYCDFNDADNVAGVNTLYHNATDWLADGEWHYYMVTMTATTACVYFDGALKNKWVIDGSTDGQVLDGLFNAGAELKYIALGGNQAFNYGDPDPGFMFDDFVVYDKALNESQIAAIIGKK